MPSFSKFLNKVKRNPGSPPPEATASSSTDASGSETTSTNGSPWLNLHTQHLTRATTATKIRLSILSVAIVDALGFTNEFEQRFQVPFLSSLGTNKNFGGSGSSNIPPGAWTDDTSMMLCLATSLVEKEGKVDQVDQMERYWRWSEEGYMSSVGRCFDIGNQVRRAVGIFGNALGDETRQREALEVIKAEMGGERSSGNGSLMRILPVGLAFWRDEEKDVKEKARMCSATTHPNTMCAEACQVWTAMIVKIMKQASGEGRNLSKLDLLDEIATFQFTDQKLREALTIPLNAGTKPENQKAEDLEEWYQQHHPLLRLIKDTQSLAHPPGYTVPSSFPYSIPPADKLSSSGYVFNTLIAALYCFFTTRTFEEGALLAVNLCDDADTVGAIYAGLAGCWYAGEEGFKEANGVYWTENVKGWTKGLHKREMVEGVAERLVKLDAKDDR